MKYLSMRVGQEDRAAIVVGDQALDVTAYCKVAEATGATCQIRVPLIDALDLHGLGREALQDIVSRVENDTALADWCRQAGALLPLDSVKLNPPVLAPGKILAVGLNYAAHAAEQNKKPPETPLIFTKNVTALLGPNQEIQLPRISQMIDYEAELAVVIGRDAKSVSA